MKSGEVTDAAVTRAIKGRARGPVDEVQRLGK